MRLYVVLLAMAALVLLALQVEAAPRAFNKSVNKTGPQGGTVQGQGKGFVVPGKGGAVQGSGTWSGKRTSGSGSVQGAWKKGTGVKAQGSATWKNKKTGESHSGSGSVDYNKETGGSATVTKDNQTRTKTLPPAGK